MTARAKTPDSRALALAPRSAAAFTLMMFCSAATVAASDAPTLRFNPFKTPPPAAPAPGAAPAGPREGTRGFEPILFSTVVGRSGRLANLGGEILSIGESANGYRLVSVRPFEATFEHDGKMITIEVSAGGDTP